MGISRSKESWLIWGSVAPAACKSADNCKVVSKWYSSTCCHVLQVKPDLTIDSPGMCRALFEVYTGSNTVVPEAKKAWAEGARLLLDSEEVRRNTRRAGPG